MKSQQTDLSKNELRMVIQKLIQTIHSDLDDIIKSLTKINSLTLTERELIATKRKRCAKLLDLLRSTLDHQTRQDLRHYQIMSSSPEAKGGPRRKDMIGGEETRSIDTSTRKACPYIENSMAADRIMIYLRENNLINGCELADYLTETLKRCCT